MDYKITAYTDIPYTVYASENQRIFHIHKVSNAIDFNHNNTAQAVLDNKEFQLYMNLVKHGNDRIWVLCTEAKTEKAIFKSTTIKSHATLSAALKGLIEKGYVTQGSIFTGEQMITTPDTYHFWEDPTLNPQYKQPPAEPKKLDSPTKGLKKRSKKADDRFDAYLDNMQQKTQSATMWACED